MNYILKPAVLLSAALILASCGGPALPATGINPSDIQTPVAAPQPQEGCVGNLLQNPNAAQFTPGNNTNLSPFGPMVVPSWESAAGSPQHSPAVGYDAAPGWLLGWGYKDGGESFAQTGLNLPAGTYTLKLAVRPFATTVANYSKYTVNFGNAKSSTPWSGTPTITSGSIPVNSPTLPWVAQTHTFTLTAPATVMQVTTVNDNASAQVNGHPELVSWLGYDGFCLQRAPEKTGRRGMTWIVKDVKTADGLVRVGNGPDSLPYTGDAPETQTLPMLCILQSDLPVPGSITPDFYAGWSKGEVKLTTPVLGSVLGSRATADNICSTQFGQGWRMGEFHDGNGGHSYWAKGSLSAAFSAQTKFWTAINDQPANIWNSVP